MTEEIKKLKELIDGTDNIVFFGGAGVSTESGIPDFRSVDGLYHQQWDDPPETILSHTYYERYPEKFFAFYRAKLLCEGAKPNAAHLKLAEWEKEGKLKAVITQNIDGLHQAAGSKNVLELHGSTLRNYCEKCGKFYDVSYIKHSQGVPRCTCGGRIKPDVVLYEEGLDEKTLYRAVEYIQEADVLIIAGTSLAVYPAAGLVRYYRGHKLVVINKTPLDRGLGADLVITGEGRMDGQTAMGKAPVGVAALAKKYGKPVLAFAGAVERDARKCNEHGIDAFFPILRGVVTLEEAMKNENAKRNLADTAEQVYRTFMIH